jgi:hypothetical protein
MSSTSELDCEYYSVLARDSNRCPLGCGVKYQVQDVLFGDAMFAKLG